MIFAVTSNAAERGLRGLVLGRNNHFGSRSEKSTRVAANLYSFIESAKLNELDPTAYFQEAIRRHHAGCTIPLPHELRHGLDPDDVDYPARPPPESDPQLELPTS